MNRFRLDSRGVLLGVGGLFTLGLAALAAPLSGPVPEVGELEPIVASLPDHFEVQLLDRGRTFGGVLASASLSSNEQQAVLSAFMEMASPRRLREGTEITLRRQKSDGWLRAIDVALNRDETVRLHRNELGWHGLVVETPVYSDTIAAHGTIESVLWSAVMGDPALQGVERQDRIRLIDQMDRIFQWKIDFTRQIQRGDSYRVVLEREVRPDGSMRSGRVLAAEIINQGKPVEAVFFDLHRDGRGGYYDGEGNSVRRSFLRRPVEFSRITSRVGARFHPILNRMRNHNGTDFAAPTGTPVYATADGVVTVRGWQGGYGNLVEIRHANGYVTRYAHLNGFRQGLATGNRVRQEEVIGYVGMTGLATGPHVHYELLLNGRVLDPLAVDIPSGDPIPVEAWGRWEAERDERLRLLDRLPSPTATRVAVAESGAQGTGQLDLGEETQ